MKKKIILFLVCLLNSCGDIEYSYYQPANPPEGIEIKQITDGDQSGDYLLIFRSENRSNKRFGGFLIFTNASFQAAEQMTSEDDAVYILSSISDEVNYNRGIDSPVVILFSDDVVYNSTFTINNATYLVTKRYQKSNLLSGYFLAIRAYLIDTETNKIIEVSNPGNIVEIP